MLILAIILDIVIIIMFWFKRTEREPFLFIKLAFYYFISSVNVTVHISGNPVLLPSVGFLVAWLAWSLPPGKNRNQKKWISILSAVSTAIGILIIHH